MKKIILLLGLQMCFNGLMAQYTLQPMLPSKGMIQKSGLWNVLIINNSQGSISGRLELTLRDRNTGMDQITASTNQVTVEKGAKQLNSTLLAPIRYNFLGDGFLKQNQDLMPIGYYIACYRFIDPNGKNVTLTEECVQFDIEPLSPPILVTPTDNTELSTQPAQFTWSPPTPVTLFNNLKYDILIVEVLPEQKKDDAILQNEPVYIENNIYNNFINYKNINYHFQKDKIYAWQVLAKDNNEYTAKSEIWSFKIADKVQKSENNNYLLLNYSNNTNTVSILNNILPIKYYCSVKKDNLVFTILDHKEKVVEQIVQEVVYGDNFLHLKIKSKLNQKSDYTVKLINTKNVALKSRFSIKSK